MAESEKVHAVNELKEAQKLADEANEKLRESLVAQKQAKDDLEIEKFRAVEMEQAGIELSQKKEEWQKEVEAVRNQHALDVASLLSKSQELQKVKQELAMTSDAKNRALEHADDATKIAEIQAEKVEILSTELVRMKASLDSTLEMEAGASSEKVLKLSSEIDSLKRELKNAQCYKEKLVESEKKVSMLSSTIDSLKQELEDAQSYREKLVEREEKVSMLSSEVDSLDQELKNALVYKEKLVEREASIEQLDVELASARKEESHTRRVADELRQRVEELEKRVEEANQLERSASESLNSIKKQLQGSNDSLNVAEAEIASLREKVGLLELSLGQHKGDIEESEHRLATAKAEASEMANMAESLKSELEMVEGEKIRALNNEMLAATSVKSLLEEKNKLIDELQNSRSEEEKSKKALEDLALALHEVSLEAREAKEKLISNQFTGQNYEVQIDSMKLVLNATNKNYEAKLGDAKQEIDLLKTTIEQTKREFMDSKVEWEQKELKLLDCIKKSDEEKSSAGEEVYELENLLKEARAEIFAAKEENAQLRDDLKETKSEMGHLKEVAGEAKAEGMQLKETLLDKENELQAMIRENKGLQTREAASLEKVEELLKLLEEAAAKKQSEENGELTYSEKDSDMLPKVSEFHQMELSSQELTKVPQEVDNLSREEPVENVYTMNATKENGKPEEEKDNGKKKDNLVEADFKLWESCRIKVEKDFSPEGEEAEKESLEGELDSMVGGGESFDQVNGFSSLENIDNGGSQPSRQEEQQKKKKPLLKKFGSLLKKRGASNQNQK